MHVRRIAVQCNERYCHLMPILTRRPINGPRLRRLRERRELSQKELAQLCSDLGSRVTQSQISHLENGRNRKPYMPLVRALATSLEAEIDDLLEDAA